MNWRIILIIISCIEAFCAKSQIALTPLVTEEFQNISQPGAKLLLNHLNSALSKAGVITYMGDSRFVIVADIIPETIQTISSAPIKTAAVINIEYTVGDYVNGQKFATNTIRTKGVGSTECMAIQDAIKNSYRQQYEIKQLIDNARNRILDYYEAFGSQIITQARALSAQNEHERALYELSLIPYESSHFEKAQASMSEIYRDLINHEANEHFQNARSAWIVGRNAAAAHNAMEEINKIDPSSPIYIEAQKFTKEISNVLSENDKRIAEEQARENEHRRKLELQEQKAQHDHIKAIDKRLQAEIEENAINKRYAISAARDIAIEYAKRTPVNISIHRHYWK